MNVIPLTGAPKMNVFLSYPHANADLAADLASRLRAEGHDVFWDRTSLPPGESFDNRIRDAIERSDLFICLITGTSLEQGKYARTELKFAEAKWPNPSGNVLPVALDEKAMENIPPYLKSVTVKRPEGDPIAEILADVDRVARRPMRLVTRAGSVVGLLAVLALVGWMVVHGLAGDGLAISTRMSGAFYADSSSGDMQVLKASTGYTELLRRGLSGAEHVDGDRLLLALQSDQRGPNDTVTSPLPVIHFAIVNNSQQTVVVDRIRLKVRESRIDARPLFWGSLRYPGSNSVINASMMLGNNGWGQARDLRLEFDLVPESDLTAANRRGDRRFVKYIPALDSGARTTVAFWEELSEYADITFLRDGTHPFGDSTAMQRFDADVAALKSALGAAPDEAFYTIGELFFSWGEEQSGRLLFQQELQIVYPGPMALPMMIVSAEYEIELKPEGTNYTVERTIAHSLKPGDTEAIDLRVWCEKSSLHEITAAIRTGDEWVEASDALRLEYYRPVGAYWMPAQ